MSKKVYETIPARYVIQKWDPIIRSVGTYEDPYLVERGYEFDTEVTAYDSQGVAEAKAEAIQENSPLSKYVVLDTWEA